MRSGKSMKLLVDTNALIDLVAKRAPFYSAMRTLCIAALFKDVQLWVTTQSYTDAEYILGRTHGTGAVRKALLKTLDLFIPCTVSSLDLKPALESDWQEVEDYLVAHAAKRIKADFLITRDAELAARSPISALTPAEFLDHLEREYGLVYEPDLEW